MVARKGDLKPMDAWEESIRDAAVKYNVIGFRPGRNSKAYGSFDMLWAAQAYAKELMQQPLGLRCVMIYAIDEYDHHALVATVNQYDKEIKKVEPKRY